MHTTPLFHPSKGYQNLLRSRGIANVLLDSGLNGLGVRTNDFSHLLAVLEEHEGGHGADAEFLRDIGHLVDVELVEAGAGVGLREPVHGGIPSVEVSKHGDLKNFGNPEVGNAIGIGLLLT